MEFCTDSIIAPSRHVYVRSGLPAVLDPKQAEVSFV
jgi:hypothetical protein